MAGTVAFRLWADRCQLFLWDDLPLAYLTAHIFWVVEKEYGFLYIVSDCSICDLGIFDATKPGVILIGVCADLRTTPVQDDLDRAPKTNINSIIPSFPRLVNVAREKPYFQRPVREVCRSQQAMQIGEMGVQ
jgi:hypothetical protein